MSKTKKTVFFCSECGNESARWVGRCPGCGEWNKLVEETVPTGKRASASAVKTKRTEPVLLKDVDAAAEPRYLTAIHELDRVLGGGVVTDSVVLIGGDPGIGKSTLSLQAACAISATGRKVLYVSGEESIKQTKMRADRLSGRSRDTLLLLNEIDLSAILGHIDRFSPDVVFIDSIQVVFQPDLSSTPGSVSQVRECSALLTQRAKSDGIAMFIIGHVTKEGMLAGPRVLEHIVDTVLYFEGERYSTYRILRAVKNRFGSTNEIGVFEMTAQGLMEVENPSQIFLAERPKSASGSVVTPIVEGTRPFLVEIQGLVSSSNFAMVRQKAQGFDQNRLAMLVAVLEKRQGMNVQDKDVFLNVVGGVRILDPAADLAVITALASALIDRPVAHDTVVIGEVGLSSEVRSVSQIASRIQEADKLGFRKCLVPKNNLQSRAELKTKQVELIPVETVSDALDLLRKE